MRYFDTVLDEALCEQNGFQRISSLSTANQRLFDCKQRGGVGGGARDLRKQHILLSILSHKKLDKGMLSKECLYPPSHDLDGVRVDKDIFPSSTLLSTLARSRPREGG